MIVIIIRSSNNNSDNNDDIKGTLLASDCQLSQLNLSGNRIGERGKVAGTSVRLRPISVLIAKILDFRGFDSSRILIQRAGILMSIGNFPRSLSQQILAGMILEGRLGV